MYTLERAEAELSAVEVEGLRGASLVEGEMLRLDGAVLKDDVVESVTA